MLSLRPAFLLALAAVASPALSACVGGGGGGTCVNGRQDPTEEGVDCGGVCGLCPDTACDVDSDCASLHCVEAACVAPTCTDGIRNGRELGVDCGGPCRPCAITTTDTCSDGVRNGDEVDVDCGGSCAACAPTPVSCDDGVRNGSETGVDCGGTCPACQAADPCADGVQNGDETDTDCGGSCSPCLLGSDCLGDDDCVSGLCGGDLGCVASVTCEQAYDCVATTCAPEDLPTCAQACFDHVPESSGVTAANAVACLVQERDLAICKARCGE